MDQRATKWSKYISMVLRHKPEVIGIELDQQGFCDTNQLIQKMNQHGKPITLDILKEIVAVDEKSRYSFNEDCTKIRANQGHSVYVNLELKPVQPPEILYHGTVERFLDSILHNGIKKGQRQYVHLSDQLQTAELVGERRGTAVILQVDAAQMHKDGYEFYLSENKVWLCEFVPVIYVEVKNK